MAADLQSIVDDLVAESAALADVLEGLRPQQWALATPAAGWSIGDQVSHLAYFDEQTLQSLTDPVRFRRDAERLVRGGNFPDRIAAEYRDRRIDLLGWFRTTRSALVRAYRVCDPGRRLPWYGPDMSPSSSVTARLMETWAHGQDVLDALGIERPPTDRLRHVAHLAVRALPYSYRVNGLPQPTRPIRVELCSPGGGEWAWGPPDAEDRVSGPAVDFCLVATQRRHVLDTRLSVTGTTARQWMAIAQAFAGPAGPGRAPEGSGAASAPGGPGTRLGHVPQRSEELAEAEEER
jgi:uncharacterized protein (TIGR03084 family)